MNSSALSPSQENVFECQFFTRLGGRIDPDSTKEAYVVLVFILIINIITCPFTVVLNVLVMVSVKIKPRLKTKSNIALACLATTDGIMGLIGQPLFIAEITAILKEELSSVHCTVIHICSSTLSVLAGASLLHLVLVNLERYMAIKHSLTYTTMVTKSRIFYSSSIAWITTLIITVTPTITKKFIFRFISMMTGSLCIVITIVCQVTLYLEARRHEKEIASQQVSIEARQKFLKEKKAFKVTTTVVVFLLLTYLPLYAVLVLLEEYVIDSVNMRYIVFFITSSMVILNSLINPIIYCIRIRQFRVAFVEILLRKSNEQAEEIEEQGFGASNAVTPL